MLFLSVPVEVTIAKAAVAVISVAATAAEAATVTVENILRRSPLKYFTIDH